MKDLEVVRKSRLGWTKLEGVLVVQYGIFVVSGVISGVAFLILMITSVSEDRLMRGFISVFVMLCAAVLAALMSLLIIFFAAMLVWKMNVRNCRRVGVLLYGAIGLELLWACFLLMLGLLDRDARNIVFYLPAICAAVLSGAVWILHQKIYKRELLVGKAASVSVERFNIAKKTFSVLLISLFMVDIVMIFIVFMA